MRKQRSTDKTTAQLLKEAATKLFARYGYEGTTVREIARLAGVTPVFDSCWKKKSLYPLYLLGYSDFYRCHEL